MARSSINFQKTKAISVEETTRQFEANYLLPKELRLENEYWNCGKSDAEVFKEEFSKAKPKGGRKPKLENSLWEAVINLNENHKMQDVQKVTKYIEKKFNIICTRIAIHRDEGKVFGEGENRTVKYNYHAHLNFVTYKDGRQNWRRQLIRRKDLSALQTEVAEILGMERGKVNSTAVRANHRELRQNYDAIMEQRQVPELKLTVTQLKKEISNLRDEMKEKNAKLDELGEQKVYTQADYVALNSLKKELKKSNLNEIYQEFLKLQKQLKSKNEQIKKLGDERKEVMDALTPTYTKMTKEGKNPPKQYKEFICFVDEELKTYEKELKIERERTKTLQTEIDTLKAEKSEIRRNMDEIEQEFRNDIEEYQVQKNSKFNLFSFLKEKIISLKANIQALFKENMELKTDNEILKKENEELKEENQELKEENELMKKVDEQLQGKEEYSQSNSYSLSR